VLQDVLHRLDRAFQAFFRRLKAGERPGYPRFRGSGWYDSFTYPQWGNGVRLDNGRLILPKIGTIRLHKDRPLEGTPKTCTIVRKADGWYASIACEVAPSPLPRTNKAVGVDVGLESFATLSDGVQIPNPLYYRAAERTLKQAQRRLSRRAKGSNRRRKARGLLAKAHLKVKRARQDFAHKTARVLINEAGVSGKDSHDRLPDGDHGTVTTGEVSLYKDTHDRQPDGDYADDSAADERTEQPRNTASGHDRRPSGDRAPMMGAPAIVSLNAHERTSLMQLGEKLELWLDDPARLSPADWEVLAPIALRLRDLLRRLDK
jgi:Probable transposase